MIRDLAALHPHVRALAEAFLAACGPAGLDVRIIETYRPDERQAALYAIGRTTNLHLRPVTNAKPGESLHGYRLAFDAAPFIAGQPAWDRTDLFTQMGEIGERVGLRWGGRWRTPDRPHFEWTGGLTLAALRAGQRPAVPEGHTA